MFNALKRVILSSMFSFTSGYVFSTNGMIYFEKDYGYIHLLISIIQHNLIYSLLKIFQFCFLRKIKGLRIYPLPQCLSIHAIPYRGKNSSSGFQNYHPHDGP